jgi:hypothetical protein
MQTSPSIRIKNLLKMIKKRRLANLPFCFFREFVNLSSCATYFLLDLVCAAVDAVPYFAPRAAAAPGVCLAMDCTATSLPRHPLGSRVRRMPRRRWRKRGGRPARP